MITKLFYFDLFGKICCQKILRSKTVNQKLRHQVVEALRVEEEAILKLPLPHPSQKCSRNSRQRGREGKSVVFTTIPIQYRCYTGWPGGRAPSFRFTQNTFLEHHVTTRQQVIMEKRITFKDNSSLKFFFHSLRNCWPPTAVHKCDAIIRLINTPLGICRGVGMRAYRIVIGTSLVIMT